MKKVVSLFMAVIMIFSIAVPSFAVSAAEAAQPAYESSANAASTTDDALSDTFGGVADFFNKAIDAIVDFFRWLFGLDKNVAEYKIVFYDGTTVINTMVVEEGAAIPSPAIPRKTGHTFIGWSPALPEIMPSYDLEVKALWSVNKYTISFDSNNGTAVDPIVQNYGSAIVAPADPVRSGYKFMGWQVYDSAEKAWVTTNLPAYMPAYNIEYRAYWIETTYTISFYINDGDETPYHTISGKFEDVIQASKLPADPVLEGHKFIGWDHPVPEKMPAKNMKITAVWAENDYTVSFVANGKVLDGFPFTAKYGTYYSIPDVPVKEGHSFVCWTDKAGNEVSVSSVVKGNFTYYAKYDANTYNVNWVIDGKTTTKKVVYGSAITEPTVVAREGYTFVRWDKAVPATMPAHDLTFTAIFDAKEVTITFVYDDGTEYKTIKQDFETKVTAPADPVKEGYTFTGWDQKIPSKMPANDMTIKASFKINQYTITFNNTGDVAYASITQDYGTPVAAVANPVKEGHTFLNWDKTIPSKMPAENLTVTAQWKVNQYTVTFNTNGGTAIAPVTQDYGTALAAPAAPVKSDYEFIGWAKVASPSVEDKVDLPATIPAENLTFYAIWRGAEKTVVFNANGGKYAANDQYTTSTKHTRTIRNGDNIGEYLAGEYEIDGVVFPQPTKNGYAVLYWSTDSTQKADMSNKVPNVLELDENTESVEYFAQWAPTYTITLKDGLTNEIIKQEVIPAGASLADFYEAEKDGYDLAGWAEVSNPTLEDKINPFTTMPKKDQTYYAIWDAKGYVLAFDAMGGEIKDVNEKGEEIVLDNPYLIKADYLTDLTNTDDDIDDLPATPEREGFIFMGWTLKKGYDYEAIEKLIEDEEKAENPDELEVTLADITATVPTEMPLDGAYYYAMWVRNEYSAEYYILSDDGESETLYEFDVIIEDETQHKEAKYATKYGTAIEIPEVDPTKEGYQFMGWYDTKEAEGGNNVKDMAMPAKGVKLYARFEKTYSFTFANCKGVNTITAIYGTDIASQLKALAPEKEGHSFAYWSGSDGKEYLSNDAIAAVYPTMPKKNITFTAEWNTNTYQIIFVTNGGTKIDPIEQLYNTPVTAPGIPVKEGYTFAGWEPAVPDVMPAGGATCEAQWTVNQYTITFVTNGDSEIDPITQDYNTAVSAPETPTKFGYVFDGWVNEEGTSVVVPSKMPAKDMTLTATWVLGDFTASFYLDSEGKIFYEKVEGKNTEAVVAPADPTKTGYKFMGWSSDGETVLSDLGVLNSDVSFYAVWEANTIEIQFVDLDGKNIGEPIEQKCNEKYNFPKDYNPVKTGYTLVWMNGSTVIEADDIVPCLADGTKLTYNADWKINQYTITFDSNGGSEVASITQDYNTDIAEPVAPVKTGHTFKGWTIDKLATEGGKAFVWKVNAVDEEGNAMLDDNGDPIKTAAKLTQNWTLVANWEINTYTATFDANGGMFSDDETSINVPTVYDEAIETPAEPTREGYTFGGWTPSVPEKMPASNVTYKAIWSIVISEAVFNANGGKFIVEGKEEDAVPVELAYGETITAPEAEPFKEGYNFIGWAETANAESALAVLGTMSEGGKTFYAVYEIKKDLQYTVETYVMNTAGEYEKTNTGKREAYYGETVDVTPAEDAIAEGFYLDDTNSELTATVTKTDEVVLKIYLARESYSVTFEGENADVDSKTGNYLYGMTISEPVAPVVEDYQTFEGWYISTEDGEVEASFPYIVTSGVTIYAKITTKTWRLDFSTDGGSYVESISGVEYGSNIAEIAATVEEPTKDGYTFLYWTYLNEDGDYVPVDSELTMPNKNFNLTAKWEKKS